MTTILDKLDLRLGHKETMIINRDDFIDLKDYIEEGEELCHQYVKEIESLESSTKQLNLAIELMEGLIECIDDNGSVTEGDYALLASRIKTVIKFINNVREG